MTFIETLSMAWEGLKLNKVRSLLTTLGVIIGVASVILMLAVSAGAEATIADQINSLGADLVIVGPMRGSPGASKTFIYEDALAIEENVSHIVGVSAEQFSTQDIKGGDGALEAISILGVTSDFPAVRDYALATGRFFTYEENDRKTKVAVLGYGIAQDLFGGEDPFGQEITIGATRLVVVGVMEEKGIVADVDYDGRVYVPITVLFQKFATTQVGSDRIRTAYVKVEGRDELDSVMAQITSLLAERHGVDPGNPDFSVQTQQDIIATQEATTEAFRDLLGDGGPAYAERDRLTATEAITLTTASGGVTSIAHPLTIDPGDSTLRSIFEELREVGLAGIEAYYSEHPPHIRTQLAGVAAELDLVATGGSDCHGTGKPGLEIGTGHGDLVVPDSALEELKARRP